MSFHSAEASKDAAVDVESRLNRLLVICQAMWAILEDKHQLTESDLVKKVTEVVSQGSIPRGDWSRTIIKCKKCGSAISLQFNRCEFCGEKYKEESAFSLV